MFNIFIIDLTYRIKFIMLKYINYKKLVIIFKYFIIYKQI